MCLFYYLLIGGRSESLLFPNNREKSIKHTRTNTYLEITSKKTTLPHMNFTHSLLTESFKIFSHSFLVLKTEAKEIPNQPISTHLCAHQGQLIMEAGTKTTIHSGAAGMKWDVVPVL